MTTNFTTEEKVEGAQIDVIDLFDHYILFAFFDIKQALKSSTKISLDIISTV